MSFQPIRKLLGGVVANHGLSQQIVARKVLELVPSVLPQLWDPDRAKYISVVSFREGVLKLESISAVALQQLHLDETRFMNELNRQLGERIVRRIEVRSRGF